MGGVYKSIDGIPVLTPNEIINSRILYDYMVVTVLADKTYKEIVYEAILIGIKREVILPSRIFKIPFFNFEDYIKIKNSNISIISDYCFAGFIYHKFGMKRLSPTINMFADNDNYYRFISNLEEYMNMPMTKVENIVMDSYLGHYAYPRGRIGDVEWEFNHDIYFETAYERWKRGVERFNWNNYIVAMTIRSDDMAYKFNSLQIKNKMGFYWKDLNLDSVIYMPQWEDASFRTRRGYDFAALINGVATEDFGIRGVNWMKVLLHQKDYVRVE